MRARYTLERTVPESGCDVLYTSYPVSVPAGVTAFKVTGVNAADDVVRTSKLAAGAVIPAGAAVIYQAVAGSTVKFVPTTKSAASVSTDYLTGCAVDSILTTGEAANTCFYEFRIDEQTGAQGFFKVDDGHRQPAATPWLCVKGTAANPPLAQYYLSQSDFPTAIQIVKDESLNDKSLNSKSLNNKSLNSKSLNSKSIKSFDLSGRRVVRPRKGQVYVVDGEKIAYE